MYMYIEIEFVYTSSTVTDFACIASSLNATQNHSLLIQIQDFLHTHRCIWLKMLLIFNETFFPISVSSGGWKDMKKIMRS